MPRPVVIAGAGIAGLTAALAFSKRGFDVTIREKAQALEAAGSGLQLSPNATRILRDLDVLDRLLPFAVRPDAVSLRDGKSLRELVRLPLGDWAETRWGAPYLAIHRADLQAGLLAAAAEQPNIALELGHAVSHSEEASLLIGADGVHSSTRRSIGGAPPSPLGTLAWRRTIVADSPEGGMLSRAIGLSSVTAVLRPRFHLIAYPVNAGAAFNLVAFTQGDSIAGSDTSNRSAEKSSQALNGELERCAPAIAALASASEWSAWPIYTVASGTNWTSGNAALIGDAAHAMTPYAAQGAAMALEDAATLAASVTSLSSPDLSAALVRWETSRRPRIAQVLRRASLNKLAWHAAGPVAIARNLVLSTRGGEKLAADMDWLYGWRG